ncbi:MAG: aminotransferase class I/II-fold pyridoxal phosphate-dependent enzyme [Acidobacteriota bacterium]
MNDQATLSRRLFAQLLGAGAATAAVAPPLFGANTYSAQRPLASDTGVVRINSNENPYGPSPAALRAITAAFPLVWRYPDETADLLIADLAKAHGIGPEYFALGDGSSELLKLAASAFTDASRRLVMADPAFEAIGSGAAAAGASIVKVPLDKRFAHDLAKMREVAGEPKGAGLVYICNPNNPTGSITPKDEVRAFLDALSPKTIVMVDEAYFHYASSGEYESVIPLVASHPNLIVLRTFSKIHGMAGLRLGYAVAQPALLEKVTDQGAWDSVNIMALAGARASLADSAHIADQKRRNSETRAWTIEALEKLGFHTIPSEANFIMVDTRREVKPLNAALRARKIHVGRVFPAMPNHMRVTIGTPEQMRAFVKGFATVTAS